MPRVLLTGSSGGVGRVVRCALTAGGWDVRPFDLADGQDLRDARSVFDAMAGCDAVIHAGAIAHDRAGSLGWRATRTWPPAGQVMPDAIFANPRLAAIYDALDPDRSDLDVYAAMAAEFGARSVLDVGCGTGTFACLLAGRGLAVTGVDPAGASLAVARAKPGAAAVRWLHGDATSLPPLQADLATMTGNVAQVFTTDEQWSATLRGVHAALRPGGRLVFETRDPARQGWLGWTRDRSFSRREITGVGPVQSWHELTTVSGELVTFRSVVVFEADDEVVTSTSTLRFRRRSDIELSLAGLGYQLDEVRDAPDRPGLEWVFIARRLA